MPGLWPATVALSTACVVAAVMVGVSVVAGPGRGDAARPSGPEGPSAALSVLARPAVAADEIPAVNDTAATEAEPYGMVAGSTRLVAEADRVGYYAAISPDGEICVLVHLQAKSQVASSCAPPRRFDEMGVWVTTSVSSQIEVTGLLLPDRLADAAREDADGVLEDAGAGAEGDARPLAPNLIAVLDEPEAAAAPTAADEVRPSGDASETGTKQPYGGTPDDVGVTRALVGFAAEPTPERAAAVGFADTVALGLGSQIVAGIPAAELVDPASWELDAELFAGRSGPVSALQVLRDDAPDPGGNDPLPVGPDYVRCVGPAGPGPASSARVGTSRLLVLQPAPGRTGSCPDWYAVGVHLDTAGQVSAIILDLYEP